MDSNIDQCSAVECTAAQPRLTKSPKKEEKSLIFLDFFFGASFSIIWDIWCLPYAGFFLDKVVKLVRGGSVINGAYRV